MQLARPFQPQPIPSPAERAHFRSVSFTAAPEFLREVDEAAKAAGVTRSALVRVALQYQLAAMRRATR